MTGILLMLVGFARADEPVDVSKIPDAVKATIAQQWPTAHAVSASMDGHEVEVVLQVDTRKMEVAFDQDGSWSEYEEKMDVGSLPAGVRTAATAQGGQIVGAEKRTLKNGNVDYEVQVKGDNGKLKELKLDEEGHSASLDRVPTEEQEDEDKKAEKNEHENESDEKH